MYETLNLFKGNFEARFCSHSILNLGEDSVRYDFFASLLNSKKLKTHEIQLEYPIHRDAYFLNNNHGSKRGENPQIDLFCNSVADNVSFTAEFGLFKRNSNPNASINKTEKIFKMLNDMLRLALNKIYIQCDAYFICVADEKIIGSELNDNSFNPFPATCYNFNYRKINELIKKYKSAKKVFDNRFVMKANELNLSIKAELIYNQQINNPGPVLPHNNLQTIVLVYKISCI